MTSTPTIALAAAALLASTGAHAVTVTSVGGAPDPGPAPGERLVVSFDAASAPGYSWSGGISTARGTLRGVHTAPAGDRSLFGYVSARNALPWATLTTPALSAISFYWGTMDSHNWLWVLGEGLQPIAFVHPRNIDFRARVAGGGNTNRRVTITAGPGEIIRGLTFWARGTAFEFDDFAAREISLAAQASAVPEPASWLMMLTGMGLVGSIARRRGGLRQVVT